MKSQTNFVKDLSKVMKDNGLAYVEYNSDDFSLKLATDIPSQQESVTSTNVSIDNFEVEDNLIDLKSPLVGHFYLAKSPTDDPYVKIGDYINAGDVIGIVQAMKVSNEVVATHSGILKEICVSNEDFVDFDATLMKVEN